MPWMSIEKIHLGFVKMFYGRFPKHKMKVLLKPKIFTLEMNLPPFLYLTLLLISPTTAESSSLGEC